MGRRLSQPSAQSSTGGSDDSYYDDDDDTRGMWECKLALFIGPNNIYYFLGS